MKKLITLVFGVVLILTLFVGESRLLAADVYDPYDSEVCQQARRNSGGDVPVACAVRDTDPVTGGEGLIIKASRLVIMVVGVTSVLMIMLGGYSYITANSGDFQDQKIKGAKNTILYAVIGLVVAVMSQIFVVFVLKNL